MHMRAGDTPRCFFAGDFRADLTDQTGQMRSGVQADVHLVVDVGEHAYLAIDKGPISDTHALVVAVEHYPNMATLKPEAIADVECTIGTLQKAYASRGLQLVGFERCKRIQNCCTRTNLCSMLSSNTSCTNLQHMFSVMFNMCSQ